MSGTPWGWASTLAEFVATEESAFVAALQAHHRARLADLPLGSDQIAVWGEEFRLCQRTFAEALAEEPTAGACLVVAEYELPGEAGRRPDIVVVTPTGHLLVLEFKAKASALRSDYDQVVGYVRDVTGYHSASHDLRSHPILVLTQAKEPPTPPLSHHTVLTDAPLGGALPQVKSVLLGALRAVHRAVEPKAWLEGTYEPLPTLVQAASEAFRKNRLPTIKTKVIEDLRNRLDWLKQLVASCEAEKRHALVLVTGAPGSGKTLLGVQTVADQNYGGRKALYLSGNGPLVGVLQDCLNRVHPERAAKSMIRGMMEFKRGALTRQTYAPANVYVFDEGQRAWTTVKDYDGTEIQLLLQVAQRREWGVVIGLIGEGQEIYQYEQGDLDKWLHDFNETQGLRETWSVYAPTPGSVPVTRGGLHVVPELHLDKSVRAKQVLHLHQWVNALLEGQPADEVRALAAELPSQGFPIYVTKDRWAAEAYVRSLYQGMPSKRYGWVASSECKYSPRGNPHGLEQVRAVKYYLNERVYGAWYNDPPQSPKSSCALQEACSEFGCQGLELDFVLVYWGDDLRWTEDGWRVKPGVRLKAGKPVEHTFNAYRVLLTRAREGMVIYVPDAGTYERLLACGVAPLGS